MLEPATKETWRSMLAEYEIAEKDLVERVAKLQKLVARKGFDYEKHCRQHMEAREDLYELRRSMAMIRGYMGEGEA